MTSGEDIDPRRFVVKVGSSSILYLAGPGLFAENWGWNGIIWYILILCIARWLADETVSRTVYRYPAAGPIIFRFSGFALFLVTIPTLIIPGSEIGLITIPVLVSLFVAGFWGLYFEIAEHAGQTTEGHQKTEVWASVISAVLVLGIIQYYPLEYAAGFGALLSLATCLYPVGVSVEQFGARQEILREQAASRTKDEIDNGALIVRAVATISFCSLSSLRLHIFLDPASIESAVEYLAIILAITELIAYFVTVKVSYDSPRYGDIALIATILGFFAMMPLGGPWYVFYLGYTVVTTFSRTFYRTTDREFSRPALKGVGNQIGLREVYRYRRMALLTPLLFIPSSMPVVGIWGAVNLSRAKLRRPQDSSDSPGGTDFIRISSRGETL